LNINKFVEQLTWSPDNKLPNGLDVNYKPTYCKDFIIHEYLASILGY